MTRLFAFACFATCFLSARAADYAQVGVMAKNGSWEIAVRFDSTVNSAASAMVANYVLPPESQLEDIRQTTLNNSVVLVVSGLATNSSYQITLTNIVGTNGSILPALTLPFTAFASSWAAVGGRELNFTPEAVRIGEDGFDLISGGVEMWADYDESTFAYEQINGDFDKRVRLVSQEPSSEEARAGLMVRETVDANKPRPADPSDPDQAFSRYLQIQVNPALTAFTDFEGIPVPGRNQYQINVRYLTGGTTENPLITTNAVPTYPNAWMRLKRLGQTFYVFRGEDGTNWIRLGTFTFPTTDLNGDPVPPFSNSAFVGPNYSPENGNIPDATGIRRAFLAQFRDYSNASGDVPVDIPTLSINRVGNDVELSWNAGTLQTTTNIAGNAWTDVGTVSPLKITPDKRNQFYRVRNP